MQSSLLPSGAFKGIRVLDLGHVLAGPFAATLLGDFGAEVIKIEPPGRGDSARQIGPHGEDGPIWWKSLARNKKSLSLDWRQPEGKKVLRKLVECSQVLVENFRPGTLERYGVGVDVLLEWNPNLVMLRISGFGQTGPYSTRPGFGKPAEGFSGVVHLTGMRDGPPMHAGFPLGDMSAGLMGAFGVSMALLGIERGLCKGQVIDLALYEAPMRLLDFHIPVATGSSYKPARNGNSQPMGLGLSSIHQSRDGRWITYSCATLETARRVLQLVGGEQLAMDHRLKTLAGVCGNEQWLNARIGEWMHERDATMILQEFLRVNAVAAEIYTPEDILADPHVSYRGNVVSIPGEQEKVVAPVPLLSALPGKVYSLGPSRVGQHTFEVLQTVIGLSPEQISALENSGIVQS